MAQFTLRKRTLRRIVLALSGAAALSLTWTSHASAQGRGHEGRDGYRSVRGEDWRERRGEAQHEFTRSAEGRRFENGIELRRGTVAQDHHWDRYFPSRVYSYPHYAATRSADVVISPFHYYYGVFPPYIHRAHVLVAAPSRIFIDIPIYIGGEYHGYSGGDHYGRRNLDDRWKDDPDLKQTIYDLEDSFRDGDIALLTRMTDSATKIAIFSRGRYDYSVEPNDYLDMTRDFMRSAHTSDFNVYRVHYRTSGVYQAFARHTYRDPDGSEHTVYLCFVLERLGGHWAITQVDSSPERLER